MARQSSRHPHKARILARIERLASGNPGDVKPVAEGVSELRIDYGPGYRVYFKNQGRELIILLAGLSREILYKALSSERTLGFDTILKVVSALGLRLHAEADHLPDTHLLS